MRELKGLEVLGLVVIDPSTGVGGRWAMTSKAARMSSQGNMICDEGDPS